MSVFSAFAGGFLNFFSIWIFCLMQIVPFLLAFMVGDYIGKQGSERGPADWREMFFAGAAPLAGFMLLFVSIGMVTTPLSKSIFRNMDILNQFGGVGVGLVGLYLSGLLTIKTATGTHHRIVRIASGLILGAALGLAYKPCVTPTLTRVYNINTMPENVFSGAVLPVFYTFGISTAVMLAGSTLTWCVSKIKSANALLWIRRLCGGLIMIVSILILTDKMTYYKSLLVERFVPSAAGEGGHAGHEHGERHHNGEIDVINPQ